MDTNPQSETTAADDSGLPQDVNAEQPARKLTAPLAHVRWGYLYPRFAIVGLFWAVCAFGLEPIGQMLLTRSAATLLQTNVGVDQLELNVMGPAVDLQRVQVADRNQAGRNSLEVETMQVAFDRTAMLQKKFIVNQATVSGIRWDTASDLAPLPENEESAGWGNPFSEQAQRLARMAAQGGGRLLQTVIEGALGELDPEVLETVRLANVKEDEWKTRYASYRNRAEKFHADVESLEKQIEQIKRGNPLDHLERYVDIGREVDRLLAEGEQLKRELTGLTSVARTDIQELNAARQRDLSRIQQGIDSIPLNSEELMIALVGPEAARQLEELAEWVRFVRKCSSVALDDYEPERGAGEFIDFGRSSDLPTYLVRRFDIDGLAVVDGQDCPFRGTMTGLTPAVRQYDKPARFDLQIGYGGNCHIKGVCDLRNETPRIEASGRWQSDQFSGSQLASLGDRQLQLKASQLSGTFALSLVGEDLSGTMSIEQAGVGIDLADGQQGADVSSPGLLTAWAPAEILQEGFAGIDSIQVRIDLGGSLRQPQIAIQSDIGPVLKDGLQQAITSRLANSQQQLAQLANQEIDLRMQKFTRQIDSEYRTLLADLKVDQELAQRLLDQSAVKPTAGVLDRFFR